MQVRSEKAWRMARQDGVDELALEIDIADFQASSLGSAWPRPQSGKEESHRRGQTGTTAGEGKWWGAVFARDIKLPQPHVTKAP